MTISAKSFSLIKQIDFSDAKGSILNAFYRNHAFIRLEYDGKGEKKFSYYTCFDKFESDLIKWLNKNCDGVWAWKHTLVPLTDSHGTKKHHNGCYLEEPNGALLTFHLYFEESADLALFLKEKGVMLKLSAIE